MSRKKIVLILFCTAVLSALFLGWRTFGQSLSVGGDEVQYNYLANNILKQSKFAAGGGDIWATSEPLYPLFLAGVYVLFGKDNFNAVRAIQMLLFSGTILFIYLIAERLVNRKLAFWSGFLSAFFFPLAMSAGRLLKEVLFTFLVVLFIYLLYKIQETLKLKWFAAGGLVLGLVVLTNAIMEFFIILVLVGWIFIWQKDFFKKENLFKVVIFILCFILMISAWFLISSNQDGIKSFNAKSGGALSRRAEMMESIRGQRYLRHLGGQIFGYYFFETEGFNPSEFLGHAQTNKKVSQMLAGGDSVDQINKKLAQESLSTITKNIPQYFAISFLDFLQFNGPMLPGLKNLEAGPMQNLFINNSHAGMPSYLKVIILIFLRVLYWLFFCLVIYGLTRMFKDSHRFFWIILIILYFNIVYSAIFGIPRYAVPIYPFYIMALVFGVFNLLDKLKLKYVRHSR